MPRADAIATLYFFEPLLRTLPSRRLGVPILMYHRISDTHESKHPYYRTATAPAVFKTQMRFLRENGFTSVNLPEALRYLTSASPCAGKPVVITFDDGYQDFYTNAFPILTEHQFTATMFLPTSYIGESPIRFKGSECLTWDQVRELRRAGIELGSHTVTHPKLSELKPVDARNEVRASKNTIEQKLGCPVTSFAYPYAFPETDRSFRDRFRQDLEEAGYQQGVCTILGTATRTNDPFFLKRLPVNSCDDQGLFRAKLAGAYDWVHSFQYGLKLLNG